MLKTNDSGAGIYCCFPLNANSTKGKTANAKMLTTSIIATNTREGRRPYPQIRRCSIQSRPRGPALMVGNIHEFRVVGRECGAGLMLIQCEHVIAKYAARSAFTKSQSSAARLPSDDTMLPASFHQPFSISCDSTLNRGPTLVDKLRVKPDNFGSRIAEPIRKIPPRSASRKSILLSVARSKCVRRRLLRTKITPDSCELMKFASSNRASDSVTLTKRRSLKSARGIFACDRFRLEMSAEIVIPSSQWSRFFSSSVRVEIKLRTSRSSVLWL